MCPPHLFKTWSKDLTQYITKAYLSDSRLFAYVEQYRYVNEGDNVLEIGKGAGVFGDIVKKVSSYTCIDLDECTTPDLVANIADWNSVQHLQGKFDIIFCCQVLEHMPLEMSKIAFDNLLRLEASKVVISIPDNRLAIRVCFKFFKLNLRRVVSIIFSGREVNINNNEEHYWEIWYKNYSQIMGIFGCPMFNYRLIKHYRFFERYKQHFFVYQALTD
jgi:hypothetical protein